MGAADLHNSLRLSLVGGAAAALGILLVPLGLQEAHSLQAGGQGGPLLRAAPVHKLPIIIQGIGDPADGWVAPASVMHVIT